MNPTPSPFRPLNKSFSKDSHNNNYNNNNFRGGFRGRGGYNPRGGHGYNNNHYHQNNNPGMNPMNPMNPMGSGGMNMNMMGAFPSMGSQFGMIPNANARGSYPNFGMQGGYNYPGMFNGNVAGSGNPQGGSEESQPGQKRQRHD